MQLIDYSPAHSITPLNHSIGEKIVRKKELWLIVTLIFFCAAASCCVLIPAGGILLGGWVSNREGISQNTSFAPEKSRVKLIPNTVIFSDQDLVSMLLRADDLPDGLEWVTGPIYSPTDRDFTSGVNIQLGGGERPDEWTYSQSVYQFASVAAAQEDYADAIARLTAFQPPATEKLPPLRADEYNLVCTQLPNRINPYCVWTARYGFLVVELLAWLEPENLSYEDLQLMIGVVDRRVNEVIQHNGSNPWGQDF